MKITKRPTKLVLGWVGVIVMLGVLSGVALAAQAEPTSDPTGEEPYPPMRVDEFATPEGPVTADTLWTATMDAIKCMEDAGVPTVGPFPAADGMAVKYSIEAVPDALDIEFVCTANLTPLAMRFGMDRSAGEAAELKELRVSLKDCVEADGVAIQESVDEANPDAGMADAAHSSKSVFRSCAEGLG